MRKYVWLLIMMLPLVALKCKEPYEGPNGEVYMPVRFKVGNQPWVRYKKFPTGVAQDSFSVERLGLYLSNFRLINTRSDDSVRTIENSYIYLDPTIADTAASFAPLNNGSYTHLQFAIGIDPVANSRLDYVGKGELNLNNGMAWDWDTGYKFLLLEGNRRTTGTPRDSNMVVHVGNNANYRIIRLPLTAPVKSDMTTVIALDADIQKLFNGKHQLSTVDLREVMVDPVLTGKLADNAATMFSLRQ